MRSFVLTYANSLFSLAEDEDITQAVMDELKEVENILKDNNEYIRLLDSPTISLPERHKLVDEAFSSLMEYVLNFIKILCEKKSVHCFFGCVKQYEKLYNKKYNIEKFTVITAHPLSDSLCEKLTLKLEKESGKKAVLDLRVDKSILGGIIIRTENSQTDASLRARLDALRAQLTSADVID